MTNPESSKDQKMTKQQTKNFDLELSDGVRGAVAKVIDKHQRIYDEKSMKDQIYLMQKFPDRKGREGKLNGVNVHEINAEDHDGVYYEELLGYPLFDSRGGIRKRGYEITDPNTEGKLMVLKLKGNFKLISIEDFERNGILDVSEAQVGMLAIHTDHRKSYGENYNNIIGSKNIGIMEIARDINEVQNKKNDYTKEIREKNKSKSTNNQGSSSDRESITNGRSPELDDSTLDTFATYYIADAMTDNDSPSATNDDSDSGSSSSSSSDD